MSNDVKPDLVGPQDALLNTDSVEQFPRELAALGVIMATGHCPRDRAFALLRSTSQNSNVKLRDLAETIVTRVSGEPPRPASPFEEDG